MSADRGFDVKVVMPEDGWGDRAVSFYCPVCPDDEILDWYRAALSG